MLFPDALVRDGKTALRVPAQSMRRSSIDQNGGAIGQYEEKAIDGVPLLLFDDFLIFGHAGLRIIAGKGRKVDDAGKRRFWRLCCARGLSTPLEDSYRGADSHRVAIDRLHAKNRQGAHSARFPSIGSHLNRQGAEPHTRVTVEDLNPVDIIAVSDGPLHRWTHLYRECLNSTLAWYDKLGESGMTYQRPTI